MIAVALAAAVAAGGGGNNTSRKPNKYTELFQCLRGYNKRTVVVVNVRVVAADGFVWVWTG